MNAILSFLERLGAWFLGLFPKADSRTEYTQGFDYAWQCLENASSPEDEEDTVTMLEAYANGAFGGVTDFDRGINAALEAWEERENDKS